MFYTSVIVYSAAVGNTVLTTSLTVFDLSLLELYLVS